jgi:hypothetical protein
VSSVKPHEWPEVAEKSTGRESPSILH